MSSGINRAKSVRETADSCMHAALTATSTMASMFSRVRISPGGPLPDGMLLRRPDGVYRRHECGNQLTGYDDRQSHNQTRSSRQEPHQRPDAEEGFHEEHGLYRPWRTPQLPPHLYVAEDYPVSLPNQIRQSGWHLDLYPSSSRELDKIPLSVHQASDVGSVVDQVCRDFLDQAPPDHQEFVTCVIADTCMVQLKGHQAVGRPHQPKGALKYSVSILEDRPRGRTSYP